MLTKRMTFFTNNFKISKNIKVVSFDVFDTLLTRPFEKPSHIFKFIEEYVNKNLEKKINFERTRKKAEKEARKKAFPREEITIDEIYENFHELPIKIRGAVKFLEIETEFKLCFPRKSGERLYNLAKHYGFKIIAISDTYLDLSFLKKLLEKNGFTFDAIFCSSSLLKRKKTGNIYPEVIKRLGVEAYDILHIGDHELSDIEKAKEKGLQTFHLPLLKDVLYSNYHYKKLFKGKDNNLLTSAIISAICETIDSSSKEFCKESLFNGSLYNLGFIGFGGIMFAFTNWVYATCIKKNVNTLFFVARDGYIMEKMMKIMFPQAPFEVKYLEVSRTSLMPLIAKTKEDIIKNYASNYRNASVAEFISQKLNKDPKKIIPFLKQIGFTSLNQKIKSLLHTKKEKEKIKQIVTFYADEILNELQSNEANVNLFLQQSGIFNERVAICDVGYGGTIQKILEGAKKGNILGLYLMTNAKAKNLKYCYGFLENNLQLKKFKAFKSFVRIIESIMLCSPSGTVTHYNNKGEPIFDKLQPEEAGRLNANSYTWKGMIDLYFLLQNRFGRDIHLIKEGNRNLTKVLNAFLKTPEKKDAQLLGGILFENKSNAGGYKDITSSDIWREGNLAINHEGVCKIINLIRRKVG